MVVTHNYGSGPIMFRFNRLFSAASTAFRIRSSRRIVDRKVLPPELSKNVVKLTCNSSAKGGICDVYLIGTVHRYPKSIQDVRAVVKFLKPQAVFLELCSSRDFHVRLPAEGDSEFREASEEAKSYRAKVILGDRLDEIGMKRYEDKFARAPFWQIIEEGFSRANISFLCRLLYTDDDAYEISYTAVEELEWKYKESIYKEIWVDERDKYMSAGLLSVARKHSTVVAVVGKGHLLGIQKYWQQPVEVKQLLSIPPEPRKFSHRLRLVVYYISAGVAFIRAHLIFLLL